MAAPVAHFTSGLVASPTLRQADLAEQIEHIHDALVLRLGVAAHDDGKFRRQRFLLDEPLSQLRQGDGYGVEKDLAVIGDGDRLRRLRRQLGAADAVGRLTFCPCTVAVVMMMKMMSST
jgi:hypothetical protein